MISCGDDYCERCDNLDGDGKCPNKVRMLTADDFAGWNEVEAMRLKLGHMPTDQDWIDAGLGAPGPVTCGWTNCMKEGQCRGHASEPHATGGGPK